MENITPPLRRYDNLDAGMLCKLFRSPGVYIPSADDHSRADDIQNFIDIALASHTIYILGRNPKHEAFLFAPNHNATTYQIHVAVREDMRGGVVTRVGEAVRWIFGHTGCKSLVSFVREGNAGVRSVLGQSGMTRCGKLTKSVMFGGEMEDELIYQATDIDFYEMWGKGD